MFPDDSLNNMAFVCLSTGIQTSSSTSHVSYRLAGEHRCDSTRRRSITNAHFAYRNQTLSLRFRLCCEPRPDFKGLRQLLITHCRFMEHVACSSAHLAVQQSVKPVKS